MSSAHNQLDRVAAETASLLQKLAKGDPSDPSALWKDADVAYEQLEGARLELASAWEAYRKEEGKTPENSSLVDSKQKDERMDEDDNDDDGDDEQQIHQDDEKEEELNAAYMEVITDAFADSLEDLRQASEQHQDPQQPPMDMDLLVSCLRSGMGMLTPEERKDFQTAIQPAVDTDGPTTHELRRRQLGLSRSA